MASCAETPLKPQVMLNRDMEIAIAVDMGCEFTKVSYWNFEDNCSSLVYFNGCQSIPTALSYDMDEMPICGSKAVEKYAVSPKTVITRFPSLIEHLDSIEEYIELYKADEVVELVQSETESCCPFSFHLLSLSMNKKVTVETVVHDYLQYVIVVQIYPNNRRDIVSPICGSNYDLEKKPSLQAFYQKLSETLEVSMPLLPTATAMCFSYGFYEDNVSKRLLLMDFGHQEVTLQVVLNRNNEYHVEAKSYCKALSYSTIRKKIARHLLRQCNEETTQYLMASPLFKAKLNESLYAMCNRNKKTLLLTKRDTHFSFNGRIINLTILPTVYRQCIEELVENLKREIELFFEANQLRSSDFDDILVAGGMANVAIVYTYIQSTFKNTYFPDLLSIYNANNNANEGMIAHGAAVQCSLHMGVQLSALHSLLFIDLLPHDLYIQRKEEYTIAVPKGVTIPTKRIIEIELDEKERQELEVCLYRKDEKTDAFVKLGSFVFPLNNIEDNTESVGISITISENGGISAVCNGSYEPEVDTKKMLILLIALLLLMILYAFLKVYFSDSRVAYSGSKYSF